MSQKIFVGMSGGVDSSLAAALLKRQGYDVTGVFMKNWTRDLPGFVCGWETDYKDAKTVAVQLDIPLLTLDFERQYRSKVVDYMLEGYKRGLTPNPDIMCNQEVKFKLFLDTSLSMGADLIATGHYARVTNAQLLTASDESKDQSYFLYRISNTALKSTLFPLGGMKKTQVRIEADKLGLATANKPDSQGICFVGEVGIKQFILSELGPQPAGDIIDQNGQKVGSHDGAIFYTVGQRHGLNVGGGLPFYVTHKDMKHNRVYVTTDLNDPKLWSKHIKLTLTHWINDPPKPNADYLVKCRYRSAPNKCRVRIKSDTAELELYEEVRAVTPGQSAVIYDQDICLGGGIIQSAV
jgi:tRNA-specific 2-thiouridylase